LLGVEIIRERWMALLVTFTVAHACTIKGLDYLEHFPGFLGWALFALSPLTALVVGINLLALTKRHRLAASEAPRSR
jgi:uncharacterized membrane protein